MDMMGLIMSDRDNGGMFTGIILSLKIACVQALTVVSRSVEWSTISGCLELKSFRFIWLVQFISLS